MPMSRQAYDVARRRRDAVTQSLQEALEGNPSVVVQTPHGKVEIASVQACGDQQATWVEIRLAGLPEGGDPHYRIYNPPTLVPDPDGPIQLGDRRYREDPLAAVAQVVATNGGRAKTRGGRR